MSPAARAGAVFSRKGRTSNSLAGFRDKDDATSLAATLGIPVGIIMSQFRKKSLAVCYGNITLPNVDVFLAYCTSQKWRTAQVYNDLAETRKANLAKSQATFI